MVFTTNDPFLWILVPDLCLLRLPKQRVHTELMNHLGSLPTEEPLPQFSHQFSSNCPHQPSDKPFITSVSNKINQIPYSKHIQIKTDNCLLNSNSPKPTYVVNVFLSSTHGINILFNISYCKVSEEEERFHPLPLMRINPIGLKTLPI